MLSACWRPSTSPRRSPRAAPHDELAGYDDGLARLRHRPRSLDRCATSSRCGRSSARSLGIALGGLDMWTNTLGFSLFGTLRHGKPDSRDARAGGECQADRLSQAGRRAHLRQAVLGVPVQHQPRGGPAGPSQGRATWRCRKHPSTTSMPGRRARYCPAGVYEWVEEARRAALRDQRAELRPLQDLRHQGPEPEHQLGAAGGRRRARTTRTCERSPPVTIKPHPRFQWVPSRGGAGDHAVLAGWAQNRPLSPDSKGRRSAAHGGSYQ